MPSITRALHAELPRDIDKPVIARFTLSLLDCDRSDPLADFFDARAAVADRGSGSETAFTIAGRDLEAFVTDARRLQQANTASALLTGGWDAENRLRLQTTRAASSAAFLARVSIVSDDPATDLQSTTVTEFGSSPDGLSAFLKEIQQLVD